MYDDVDVVVDVGLPLLVSLYQLLSNILNRNDFVYRNYSKKNYTD